MTYATFLLFPDFRFALFQYYKELSFPVKLGFSFAFTIWFFHCFFSRISMELATAIEASRDIIGKYERNENSPFIEMALKIARIFDVPVDYLPGEGKHAAYDKETIKRLEDIQVLDNDTKAVLFNIIDTFLRDAKARKAYGQ